MLNKEADLLSSRQDIQGHDVMYHSQDSNNDNLESRPYKIGLIPHTTAAEEKVLWRNYIKWRHIKKILNSANILENSPKASPIVILQIIKEISSSNDLIMQIRHQVGLDELGDIISEDEVENAHVAIELYRLIQLSKGKDKGQTVSSTSETCCLEDLLGYMFSEVINNIAFGKGNPNLVAKVSKAIIREPPQIKSELYELAINIELLPKSLVKVIDPRTPINKLPDSIKLLSPDLYSEFVLNNYRAFILNVRLAGEQAFNRIIESHLWLVEDIANKHFHTDMSMSHDDLIQEGCLGLIDAAERFNPTLCDRFMQYAHWWIRQKITRAIVDQGRTIRIPVHMVETINKLMRVTTNLIHEYGREPTLQEIGEAMEMHPQKVEELIRVSQLPVSLESPISDEEDSRLSDYIEDLNAMRQVDAVSQQLLKEQIDNVLSTLTPREQRVLRLRFGLKDGRSRTLEEIGAEFNVTRERIRQIEAKALRRLRHPSRSRKLKEYLE